MIASFSDGLEVLYHHAKFGKIVQCAPAVGAKILCLYVFVCFFCHALRLARCSFEGVYFEHVLCRWLLVDFDAIFRFFSERIALSDGLDSSHFCW